MPTTTARRSRVACCRHQLVRRQLVESLERRRLLAGNLIVSDGSTLTEYTMAGTFVRSVQIPNADAARDVALDGRGYAHVFNGVFDPILSTYSGGWTHQSGPAGWSIVNNVSYGGIAAMGTVAFAVDMSTAGKAASGLVRFDTVAGTSTRFAESSFDSQYVDVTLGLDGKLYALNDLDEVHVFDPVTLARTGTVSLSAISPADARAIAVDTDGALFIATWGEPGVIKLSPTGSVLAQAATVHNGVDIDLHPDGTLLVGTGHSFGTVQRSDRSLSAFVQVASRTNGRAMFVEFGSLPAALAAVPSASTYRVLEGAPLALSGAGSTGPDIVSYEWDFDYVGGVFTPDASGVTTNLTGLDGPSTRMIALRVTNASGATHVAASQVIVSNVVPALSVSAPAAVGEGESFSLQIDAADPGDDTVDHWVIDWGDGNVQTIAGDPLAVAHTYADAPLSTQIVATAYDEDGLYTFRTGTLATRLDTTFGTGGRTGVAITDTWSPSDPTIALDSQGRTLVGGDDATPGFWTVQRLLSGGGIDTLFGSNGTATIDVPGTESSTLDVDGIVELPGGKILLAGTATPSGGARMTFVRLNPNGSLDTTYGGGTGIVQYGASTSFSSARLIVPVSGGYLVGGMLNSNGAVMKLTSTGTLDGTFGAGGGFNTPFGFPTTYGAVADVEPQFDGRFYVTASGPRGLSTGPRVAVVARYLANGQPDMTFGISGRLELQIGGANTSISDLAVDPNGNVLFVGHTGSTSSSLAVGRVTSAGQLDTTWGNGGVATPPPFIHHGDTRRILARGDGGASVFTGLFSGTSGYDPAVWHLDDGGGADASFGSHGIFRLPRVGGTFNSVLAIDADDTGRVAVLAGDQTLGVFHLHHDQPRGVAINVEARAPVAAGSFARATRHEIRFEFSEQMGASVDLADLTLTNLTTGQTIDVSTRFFMNATIGGSAPTRATWIASTPLPDGNYRATIPAGAVVDDENVPSAMPITLDFHVLAGDANGDRAVNFDDLLILAQNYGTAGRTFAEGNFNYSPDGIVNFDDLLLLAQRYGTTLALAAPAMAVSPAATAKRRPTAAAGVL